ncbi:MAG: 6-phosphofructokinase [Candidatus Omnitrophica bacterium]|nr:6-phosphofructokinase [Candidatus Omnitrophota bacterium]
MKTKQIKRLAVLTSGGDAPGMNAAIRSVVRMANCYGIETLGFLRGYHGLLENEFVELGPRSVSNTIHRGGTILKTSRCKEFETKEGLKKAAQNLEDNNLHGLIVIGGNGTCRGAYELGKFWKGQILNVPSTIDNDVYGTDATIGYDTAVNTGVAAIDKIRDTADAHERFFLVEVMGRKAGFIGLNVGIAGGAEEIMIPEKKQSIETIHRHLCSGEEKGKKSSIIVISEGDEAGGALEIAKKLKSLNGCEYKVVVLGHTQRGGSPTAHDRILATELGAFAVEQFLKGKSGVSAGKRAGKLVLTPLKLAWSKKKSLNPFLLKLLPILST